VIWLISRYGTYDCICGSLGAIAILLFWFWLSAFSAVLGAELDKIIEDMTPAPDVSAPAGRSAFPDHGS